MTNPGREPLGRGHRGERDPVEGYQVITIDGARVGTVAGSSSDGLVVRCGNWPRRSLRALPVEQAVIRDVDRTVLMLASPETLRRHEPPVGAATEARSEAAR